MCSSDLHHLPLVEQRVQALQQLRQDGAAPRVERKVASGGKAFDCAQPWFLGMCEEIGQPVVGKSANPAAAASRAKKRGGRDAYARAVRSRNPAAR